MGVKNPPSTVYTPKTEWGSKTLHVLSTPQDRMDRMEDEMKGSEMDEKIRKLEKRQGREVGEKKKKLEG